MTLPRKTNINVYRQIGTEPTEKELIPRRQ